MKTGQIKLQNTDINKKAQGLFKFPYWVSYDRVTPNSGTSRGQCKLHHFLHPRLSNRLPGSFHKICLKLSNPYVGK